MGKPAISIRLLFALSLSGVLAVPLAAESLGGKPPLNWAAERGQVEICRLLLQRGAAVNGVDLFGNTPLHLAIRFPLVVDLLLKSGAGAGARNAVGNTPLHLALASPEVVKMLLAGGADANARNLVEKTPLDYCMMRGTGPVNLQVMKLLIEAGSSGP